MKDIYKIYISHCWQYGEEYDELVALLKDPYFQYKNFSAVEEIDGDFPKISSTPIDRADFIRRKISESDIVIILAGKYYEFNER